MIMSMTNEWPNKCITSKSLIYNLQTSVIPHGIAHISTAEVEWAAKLVALISNIIQSSNVKFLGDS